ncbi:hypothetical protein HCC75_12520 (plasmid) [Levilactobacillus brevis]|uniref:PBECR4 domain-containing protein n=1 Tax=Levilactobacillus brevis TaxID=1580 RepID=UPI0018676581|nr:hypothetical protein HCC75_12520 [Levilactobacillus brevis]
MTPSEINSFKSYLPSIQEAFLLTQKHFIGKIKTYVYVVNNRKICSLPITFQNKHFMHLCGVKYATGARGFIKDLKRKQLNFPNCQIKCNTFDLFLVIGLVNRSLAELPLPIDS